VRGTGILHPGRRTSALLGQVSRTIQEVQRTLLTPDECLRMPGPVKNEAGDIVKAGDMVIYVAGYPAIYGALKRRAATLGFLVTPTEVPAESSKNFGFS
jgi:hypothetical protein